MGHYCQHRKEDEQRVPRISMDYFFVSKEDEGAANKHIGVMKNEGAEELYARAAGQNGLSEDGSMD